MPLAVAAMDPDKVGTQPLTAMVTYLIVYAAMNLGAFAVVIAVSRKTRSGEISSYGGLLSYSPVLGDADDDLHRAARRNSAARRVDRKVLRFKAVDLGRDHVGLRTGLIELANSVIALATTAPFSKRCG